VKKLKHHALRLKVHEELVVEPVHQVLQPKGHALQAGLAEGVVVLYIVQHFGEAPVGVGLHICLERSINTEV
jgi:hypothetical protein